MNGQLDMFSALGAKAPEPAPEPMQGMEYLDLLIDAEEIYIFLIGSNDHLRYVRSYSSTDPGAHWNKGQGVPVNHARAQSALREAGYHRHSRHTFGDREVGNTGNKLKADVWRSR